MVKEDAYGHAMIYSHEPRKQKAGVFFFFGKDGGEKELRRSSRLHSAVSFELEAMRFIITDTYRAARSIIISCSVHPSPAQQATGRLQQ